MANGPQLTTAPFTDKRCIHTSRQDRLLCLTLIVFSLSVPKQQEVYPNSSGSTGVSGVSRLNDVLQLPDRPKQISSQFPRILYNREQKSVYLAARRKKKKAHVSVLSVNLKKMQVLQFFWQLHQAFSFGIVVWDYNLLRHGNWGELGPF